MAVAISARRPPNGRLFSKRPPVPPGDWLANNARVLLRANRDHGASGEVAG